MILKSAILPYHITSMVEESVNGTPAILSQIKFNGNTIFADNPHGNGGYGTINLG